MVGINQYGVYYTLGTELTSRSRNNVRYINNLR